MSLVHVVKEKMSLILVIKVKISLVVIVEVKVSLMSSNSAYFNVRSTKKLQLFSLSLCGM